MTGRTVGAGVAAVGGCVIGQTAAQLAWVLIGTLQAGIGGGSGLLTAPISLQVGLQALAGCTLGAWVGALVQRGADTRRPRPAAVGLVGALVYVGGFGLLLVVADSVGSMPVSLDSLAGLLLGGLAGAFVGSWLAQGP